MADTDVARLANFQKHFEDMRAHIHCKICLKPFYEPFTLSCGHTYCYSCLSSWCTGTHNRGKAKTCPDCRAVVMTQPSPNFLLRDLVQMFLTHTELLPEDETMEEHRLAKDEEAKLVATDRAGQGLFKGIFVRERYHMPGWAARAGPILDAGDGVERCPECTWELEDGECNQCGWGPDTGDDDSYDSDDDERDISPIDDFHGPLPLANTIYADIHNQLHREASSEFEYDDEMPQLSPADYSVEDDDSEDDSENEDDDDDMSGFITNDEDLPHEVDDDDESVHTIHGYNVDSPAREQSTNGGYDTENSVAPQPRSPPRFYGIDLAEDSNDDNSDSGDENTTITSAAQTGSEDDESEAPTNYDTDSSSIREISPPPPPPPIHHISSNNRAKRRRIIDDEDDEDEDSAASDDTATRPAYQRQRRANDIQIRQMPERRRVSLSPDDEPVRATGRQRRGRGTEANAVPIGARRGRPIVGRVY